MNRMEKLTGDLDSPAIRLDVFRKVRQAFKGVKALCAATASEYLIRAGYLNGYRPWTADLSKTLTAKGARRFDTVTDCEPYSLCYSVDGNRNGAPDHVYIFLCWIDPKRQIAEVVDNYSPHPHPRNLGGACWYKGKHLNYGRYWYGQVLPS